MHGRRNRGQDHSMSGSIITPKRPPASTHPCFRTASVDRLSAPRPTTSTPAGANLTVEYTLDGSPFIGLNGGRTSSSTKPCPSRSIAADQAEVDRYWDALVQGGASSVCGWLRDRSVSPGRSSRANSTRGCSKATIEPPLLARWKPCSRWRRSRSRSCARSLEAFHLRRPICRASPARPLS